MELARKRRKIERSQNHPSRQKANNAGKKIQPSAQSLLSGEQIAALRKNLQISQRTLAEKIGKSQSWIRDIENGRFQIKKSEQQLIRQALGL